MWTDRHGLGEKMVISRSLKELGSTAMAEAKGKVDLEGAK